MMRDLKPYPTYKDSGVPWLGQVPEHWEVIPNRAVFTEVKERDHPYKEMLSVTITQGVIRQQVLLMDSSKKDSSNQDKTAYKLVRPGDIAYNKMRAWQGAVGVSNYQGIVSPAYVIMRPRGSHNARYFHYLLRTPAFAKEAERWSYGITSDQWSLRPEHFKMIYSSLPPAPEQSAIVRYLDYMDRRIRRYVRAKQKLIKLLEEQKQAIIHRAVTRGLDPNVRLKPSGVEWLGDVPEHWEIKKLKHVTRFYNGLAFKPSDWSAAGVPIIRIQNLNGADDFNYTTKEDLPQALRIRPGDLLFSWSGNRGTSFGSFIWDRDFDGYLNQHIFKLDGYSLDRRYFAHLLRAVTRHVEEQTHGIIGLVHITKPELGAVLIPVPPLEEQKAIARSIDERVADLQAVAERTQREIALLREYRTRLIADVVTGKLDVREAAVNLPEEAEEVGPLDEMEAVENGEEAVDEHDPEEAEA